MPASLRRNFGLWLVPVTLASLAGCSQGAGGAGGGSGGDGGSGACDAESCDGCCDENGTCQAGTAISACGAEGAACATCTEACVAGACMDTADSSCGAVAACSPGQQCSIYYDAEMHAVHDCTAGGCDIFEQDCQAADETCHYVGGVRTCAPAGDVSAGGACGSSDDCGPGMFCDPLGRCKRYCSDTNPCAAGYECLTVYQALDTPHEDIFYACEEQCDLIANDCANPSDTCIVWNADTAYTMCAPPGVKAQGEQCTAQPYATQCQAGLVCGAEIGAGSCAKPCTSESPCVGGDCVFAFETNGYCVDTM